ncbi:MAG: hypothetical protein IPL03_08515 [Sterolibacteriaceae bacterium]|nr:hypothetical protein [Candidatus Methylophosphatis haderslevensis]
MNNEHLYERVVEELRVLGPKEGLWAKAFAETNGQEAQAKALYLRYRVEQLAELERESARLDAERAEERSRNAALAAEEERKVRAAKEGVTPMHFVLGGLALFILLLVVLRALGGA